MTADLHPQFGAVLLPLFQEVLPESLRTGMPKGSPEQRVRERLGSDLYKKALKEPKLSSAFGPKDPRYEIDSREGAYSPPSPSVPLFVRGRRNKKVPEDVHPQALCYSFTVIARRQF